MARKVWLVVLTLLTIAFVAALIALSEPRPTVWLTDQEVDELVYKDMLEQGIINPETGKIIY